MMELGDKAILHDKKTSEEWPFITELDGQIFARVAPFESSSLCDSNYVSTILPEARFCDQRIQLLRSPDFFKMQKASVILPHLLSLKVHACQIW